MSEPLLKIGVDVGETVKMFEAFGFGARSHCRAVAFITANAVKAQAQATIPKRRPFTVNNVVVESRRTFDGFVVMMNRSVKDSGNLSVRQATSAFAEGNLRGAMKTAAKRLHYVGKWLEFGTVKMKAKPWLFPSADAQEGAHLQRVSEALERAKQEAGGNG